MTREGLLRAFARAGAETPRSYLATGNFTFAADAARVPAVAQAVEDALKQMSGADKRVFTRPIEHLAQLEAREPFRHVAIGDAHERCVSFLPEELPLDTTLPFESARQDFVVLEVRGAEVFSYTRLVDGRPGNPSAWLERCLKAPVTTRNWNTVLRVLRAPGP